MNEVNLGPGPQVVFVAIDPENPWALIAGPAGLMSYKKHVALEVMTDDRLWRSVGVVFPGNRYRLAFFEPSSPVSEPEERQRWLLNTDFSWRPRVHKPSVPAIGVNTILEDHYHRSDKGYSMKNRAALLCLGGAIGVIVAAIIKAIIDAIFGGGS